MKYSCEQQQIGPDTGGPTYNYCIPMPSPPLCQALKKNLQIAFIAFTMYYNQIRLEVPYEQSIISKSL